MKLGIVGGGPAAIAMLDRLIQSAEAGEIDTKSAHIAIFEKAGVFGRGVPYNPDLMQNDLRLNIAAVEPGISDEAEDFHAWLEQRTPEELDRMRVPHEDGKVPEDGCYSRVLAQGAYLEDYGQKLLERAQAAGLDVKVHLNSEVIDAKDEGGVKQLFIQGQKQPFLCDTVYLALGHWSEADPVKAANPGEPAEFKSPWPASKLGTQIPQGSIVGVIGTGPTGADAAIVLGENNGTFERQDDGKLKFTPNAGAESFKVIMASKSGLLPQLRGPIDMEEYVSEDDFLAKRDPKTGLLPLNGMFDVFKGDMVSRYPQFAASIPGLDKMSFVDFAKWLQKHFDQQGGGDEAFKLSMAESRVANDSGVPLPLQDVFINLYVFSEIHKYLSAEDKVIFQNQIKPILAKVNAPLPPEIAEKIEAMQDAGALELRKADASDPKKAFEGEVNAIVNAIGQSGDMSKHPSALVQNLRKRGILAPEKVGFENNDPDFVAKFGQENGVASKISWEGDKASVNIGGVSLDEDYTMKNAKGERQEGWIYVGPNCPRVYDSYSLIFSRDASSIIVNDDFKQQWNVKAALAEDYGQTGAARTVHPANQRGTPAKTPWYKKVF